MSWWYILIGIMAFMYIFYVVEGWARREEYEDEPTVGSSLIGTIAGVVAGIFWPVVLGVAVAGMVFIGCGYVLKYIYTGILRLFEKREPVKEFTILKNKHFKKD